MNAFQTILLASKSHAELLAEAKDSLREIGGCDHSVGICVCGLRRKIEHGDGVQLALDTTASKIEGKFTGEIENPLDPPTPLHALRRVEVMLRGTDYYHIAVDRNAQLGLGDWLKLVIAGEESRINKDLDAQAEFLGVNNCGM